MNSTQYFYSEALLSEKTVWVITSILSSPPPPHKNRKLNSLWTVQNRGEEKVKVWTFFMDKSQSLIFLFFCSKCVLCSPKLWSARKIYMGALGDFTPEMLQKEPSKIKKEPLKNRHRLQCKSLFNVADLVNGMWKVAPKIKIKNLIFGLDWSGGNLI